MDASVTKAQLRLAVSAEAFEGLGDVRGMLLFDGRELRFDFQTSDALFGLLRSDARKLQVPLAAVEQVHCGLGWFWLMPYIQIELNDFALLSKVPGAHKGAWRLRVRFRDRHALKRFADAVAFARAQHLHDALQGSLESPPPAPSIHTEATPPHVPEAPPMPPRRQAEDQ